jgi:hypothetical protein
MFIIFSISDLQFAEKFDFQNKNNRYPIHLQGKGIRGKGGEVGDIHKIITLFREGQGGLRPSPDHSLIF